MFVPEGREIRRYEKDDEIPKFESLFSRGIDRMQLNGFRHRVGQGLAAATAVLACSLFLGVMTAYSEIGDPSDEMLLSAMPISRARMELIWVDPPKLAQLAVKVQAGGGKVITIFYDSADQDLREHEITVEDIRWAKEVEKVVDVAYAAGQAGRLEEALRYYKKALLLAPGGDLFLMSVGVAYVQLGEKERGIRFLERAAGITPTNGRIKKNLQAARGVD